MPLFIPSIQTARTKTNTMKISVHLFYMAAITLAVFIGRLTVDEPDTGVGHGNTLDKTERERQLTLADDATLDSKMETCLGENALPGDVSAERQRDVPSTTAVYVSDERTTNSRDGDHKDSPAYLLSALGLSDSMADGNDTSVILDIESKLVYGQMSAEKRMDLLVNYLNNYHGRVSDNFFNDLLSHAGGMPEREQHDVIRLTADSFYDDLSLKNTPAWQIKIDGLMNFANSQSESIRETLLLSVAAVPGLEEERELLLSMYRADPSSKIRALTTIIDEEIRSSSDR